MATSKSYRDYILEQLQILDDVICRPMMGEYLLYYRDKLFGGLYDDRLLIKIVPSNKRFSLTEVIPYSGAKAMYLVDFEDSELLRELIITTWEDLPYKKKKN